MIADGARIDALAIAIQDWNSQHARLDSPALIAGERPLAVSLPRLRVPVNAIRGERDQLAYYTIVRNVTGAPIISTATEKQAIEERMAGARVDRVVEDADTLGLGNVTIEFVHAPGHTYGSLAVFLREARALFTGDNVMGTDTSVINPGEGEIGLFLQTMEKFMRYDPAVIYPGQGPAVTTRRAKLQDLVRHRHEREAQIVELLALGPRSVDDLFRVVYSGLDERVGHLARNQIKSHLVKLEREGRVAASGQVYRLRSAS